MKDEKEKEHDQQAGKGSGSRRKKQKNKKTNGKRRKGTGDPRPRGMLKSRLGSDASRSTRGFKPTNATTTHTSTTNTSTTITNTTTSNTSTTCTTTTNTSTYPTNPILLLLLGRVVVFFPLRSWLAMMGLTFLASVPVAFPSPLLLRENLFVTGHTRSAGNPRADHRYSSGSRLL
eukprot:GHVT01018995.1.p1 GENE.GHVT01018995.1~~GHVT01018995.1.p1  ORF type:complete len:175 (-),score=13.84 GHVT01018995.1:161-685(-)